MSGYIGVEPVPRASRVLTEGTLTSDTQTIPVPGGFTPNNIAVYINGNRLPQTDYDDSTGFELSFDETIPQGAEYVIEEFRSFDIADHYTKEEIDMMTSSAPLTSVFWAPSRANIWEGFAAADGQELSRDTYPNLWQMIQDGKVPTVDESTWNSDPTQRGKYTTGDGSTTFRVPDYNGKSAGAVGGVYLTGDGLKTAAENGLIRYDQMQQITGSFGDSTNSGGIPISSVSGATLAKSGSFSDSGNEANTGETTGGGINTTATIEFDSADSPDARTGDYTHGIDVSGCWVIRLFGKVTSVGTADAAQLATDYANLAGEVQNKLDANDALGGAAQSWQDVSADRQGGVTYTNTTGRPILVAIGMVEQTGGVDLKVDGVEVGTGTTGETMIYGIVPNNSSYQTQENDTFDIWSELR